MFSTVWSISLPLSWRYEVNDYTYFTPIKFYSFLESAFKLIFFQTYFLPPVLHLVVHINLWFKQSNFSPIFLIMESHKSYCPKHSLWHLTLFSVAGLASTCDINEPITMQIQQNTIVNWAISLFLLLSWEFSFYNLVLLVFTIARYVMNWLKTA